MDARLDDVTDDFSVFSLMGPRARDVLGAVCGEDLSNDAFPFGTWHAVTIAGATVRALRITYVGELGWELYVPTEFALHVVDEILREGEAVDLRPCGFHAMATCRLEKAYRHWGHDIGPEDTPLEAGLGFAVAWGKAVDFVGRTALEEQRKRGLGKRLLQFQVRDPEVMLYHDRTLARLTSDPREFGDLTRSELSEFDVGSWFGDAFQGERIAGLDEALAAVRGRASLMIDMKALPGQEERLAQAVIDALGQESDIRYRCWATQQEALTAVTACGFPNALMDMRLATTSPALVRYIKQQAPGLRVTLLAQLILPGTLDRRQFDALGLRHNRISAQEVRLAALFGYEIHAWTVNDRARMSALIDLGVDAIITDYPDRLHALTEDRRALSDGGLMLVKLRNWLRQ
jgi:glycerophosphoryl diester phosphodiesterase